MSAFHPLQTLGRSVSTNRHGIYNVTRCNARCLSELDQIVGPISVRLTVVCNERGEKPLPRL